MKKTIAILASALAQISLLAFNPVDYKLEEMTEISDVYTNKDGTKTPFTMSISKPIVIVQGMTFEENTWGKYQFPIPYDLGDRILVAVHVDKDDANSFGTPNRWFESKDKGLTWKEIPHTRASEAGTLLKNGDRLYFPPESGISLANYKTPAQSFNTPDYDFTKQAEEGTLPLPDGITSWWLGGVAIRAYNADRLPPSLAKKQWLAIRTPSGQKEAIREYSNVDWKYLTRVIYNGRGFKNVLKPIFPQGVIKHAPDGSIWISAFSGEGHINPETKKYSPYYSAEIFRSDDFGHNFTQVAHMEYEADGKEYPYDTGGFSDSDFEFMPDGSIVWFMRTQWFHYTGLEWSPMYMSRSTDMGKTWSKPKKFSDVGVLPRLCKLKCGITILCYARPGTYIQATTDDTGTKWTKPLVMMTPNNRSHLANKKPKTKTFASWVGSCNNPKLVPLSDNQALIVYSDFYYPDKNGIKRKSILCRQIFLHKK